MECVCVCTSGTHSPSQCHFPSLPVHFSALCRPSASSLSVTLFLLLSGAVERTAHVQLTSIESCDGWRCVQLSPIQTRMAPPCTVDFLLRHQVPPLEPSVVQSCYSPLHALPPLAFLLSPDRFWKLIFSSQRVFLSWCVRCAMDKPLICSRVPLCLTNAKTHVPMHTVHWNG